ncbi:MAG: hypothetical protein GY832_01385 [Chloroflexi bacterium]|nr:hypothetical protein [Chloroflexota bacterium]
MPNTPPQLMAGGNIYPSRFVKIDASNDFKGLQAGDNVKTIGISDVGTNYAPLSDQSVSAYAAKAGQNLRLFGDGDICLLKIGGTVTAGDELKSDADGQGVSIAGSGTTNQRVGAVAIQSGVSGNFILVQVRSVVVIYES